MKYITQFFKDFGKLQFYEFARKYFLLPVTILFLCIALGNLIELSYILSDLEVKRGAIIDFNQIITKVINKPAYKGIEQETNILLDNYPEYFRLTNNIHYSLVVNDLTIGDTVTIYYRKKYMVPLGFGQQTDIYQLEYKNQILLDLNQRKKNSKGIMLIGIIASTGFGGFYFYLRRKRKKQNMKVVDNS